MTEEEQTPAPRQIKGDRTKARVIEAALGVFAQAGFDAVSLREIATSAGLTHAGLLHHFPGGKPEILSRILESRDAADAAEWRRNAAGQPIRSLAQVAAIVRRNADTHDMVALYARISNEASNPAHPAHDYFAERYERLRSHLAEQLEQAMPVPPPMAPSAAAQQLIALIDGLQTQWLLTPDRIDMGARVVDFLLLLGIDISRAE